MYRGDNQTALESQKVIGEAFLKLMNEKQYTTISVKEICLVAGVSRQTFYSLFETKENVVTYLMKRTCTHPDEECFCRRLSLDAVCDEFAEFIYVNFEFLQMLVEHDLYCVLYKSLYQGFAECDGCTGIEGVRRDDILRFITGGLTGFISSVVTEDTCKDLEYLRRTMKRLFRGEFFAG